GGSSFKWKDRRNDAAHFKGRKPPSGGSSFKQDRRRGPAARRESPAPFGGLFVQARTRWTLCSRRRRRSPSPLRGALRSSIHDAYAQAGVRSSALHRCSRFSSMRRKPPFGGLFVQAEGEPARNGAGVASPLR